MACWILSRGPTGAFAVFVGCWSPWKILSPACIAFLSMEYPDGIALNNRDIDHLSHREVCRQEMLSLLNFMWWSHQGPVATAVSAWILQSARRLHIPGSIMMASGETTSSHNSLLVRKYFPEGPWKALLASSLIKTGSCVHSAARTSTGVLGYCMHTCNQSRRRPGAESRLSYKSPTTGNCSFPQHGPQRGLSTWKLRNKASEHQHRLVLIQAHLCFLESVSDFVVDASSGQELGLIFLPLIKKVAGDVEPEVFLRQPCKGRQTPQSWYRTHQTPNSHHRGYLLPQRGSRVGVGMQRQTASSNHSKLEIKQTTNRCFGIIFILFFVLFSFLFRSRFLRRKRGVCSRVSR